MYIKNNPQILDSPLLGGREACVVEVGQLSHTFPQSHVGKSGQRSVESHEIDGFCW